MKSNVRIIVLSIVLSTIAGTRALAGTIIVKLEGLSTSKGGRVYTAVFLERNFLKFGEHVFGNVTPVMASQTQIVFEHVPAGTYGIATFQDIDGSEDLSKNFLGIPKEPMGFSRNPRIGFGPPDFNEAEIAIGPNETVEITIKMK